MTEPFIGEIRVFGGIYAPHLWADCGGAIIAVSQNQALFSLIGTAYGGDGRSDFGLPDLRGRLPMHQGTGPGLTQRILGQRLGTETVTLSSAQLPAHTHAVQASTAGASTTSPDGAVTAGSSTTFYTADVPSDANVDMASGIVGASGGGKSHINMMPYLVINFIIAMQGTYPSRN